MFQVIKLCGNFEPWWFLEDWQNDIVSSHLFFDFDQALTTYRELWNDMMRTYPYHKSKKNLLATFWDEDDQIWCEECDEDLQQYNSIMLLKNCNRPITRYIEKGSKVLSTLEPFSIYILS